MKKHEYRNSDPQTFDANCSTCGGKDRDSVHDTGPHTRGNWQACELGVVSDCINADGNFYVSRAVFPDSEQDRANRILISCAPELLAAAQAWDFARREGGISHADFFEAAWEKTRIALDKYNNAQPERR